MAERFRMSAAELVPGKFAVLHPFADLLAEIDRRNKIVIRHPFVIQDNIRHLAAGDHRDKRVVDEMQHDDIHFRVAFQSMAHFPFHAAYLFEGAESVRVVVYGGFDEKKVDFPFRKDVMLQAEGTRSRPGRTDACFYPFELCIRETLL